MLNNFDSLVKSKELIEDALSMLGYKRQHMKAFETIEKRVQAEIEKTKKILLQL